VTTGLALALLALVIGLGLVVLEFLIPSFGVIGITAAACLGGAIILAFIEHTGWGFAFLCAVIVGVPAMLALGARLLPHTPLGRRLILSGPVTAGSGAGIPAERLARLVGRRGIALTPLRPAGAATIDEARVDVVAETDWIDAQTPVEVVRVNEFRVVVRPCATAAATPAPAAPGPGAPLSAEESSHA
jgi:membrane-bound serine protease (ClpP class)